jgi:hypothetical protein
MKNFGIILGKVFLLLLLVGVIGYTHWIAYNEGGQRGFSDGQHSVAQYAYGICNSKHKNTLTLYRTEFHCARLQKL